MLIPSRSFIVHSGNFQKFEKNTTHNLQEKIYRTLYKLPNILYEFHKAIWNVIDNSINTEIYITF